MGWRRGYYRAAWRGRPGNGVSATERNIYAIAEMTAFVVATGLMYFELDFSAVSSLLIIAIGFVSTVSFRLSLSRLGRSQVEPNT